MNYINLVFEYGCLTIFWPRTTILFVEHSFFRLDIFLHMIISFDCMSYVCLEYLYDKNVDMYRLDVWITERHSWLVPSRVCASTGQARGGNNYSSAQALSSSSKWAQNTKGKTTLVLTLSTLSFIFLKTPAASPFFAIF